MQYKIINTDTIYIVGLNQTANFTSNGLVTAKLAKSFMPIINLITNRVDQTTISLQNYTSFNIENFSPAIVFEKWIGVQVKDLNTVPDNLQSLTINAGKYLVINFEGTIEDFVSFWQDIHFNWLPNSEFKIDNRPHFERLGPEYNPNQAVNKEEIWIPIK